MCISSTNFIFFGLLSIEAASLRKKIQIATKFEFVTSEPKGHPLIEVKGSPRQVRACFEASLERLHMDYIDLYFQHRVDTLMAIEDTVCIKYIISFLLGYSLQMCIELMAPIRTIEYYLK